MLALYLVVKGQYVVPQRELAAEVERNVKLEAENAELNALLTTLTEQSHEHKLANARLTAQVEHLSAQLTELREELGRLRKRLGDDHV